MKIGIIVLVVLGLNGIAHAGDVVIDQKGWIVGGGLSSTHLTVTPINQPGTVSSKESAVMLTAFGGYNFTNWFGIEFDVSISNNLDDVNTGNDAQVFASSFTPKFTLRFDQNWDMYFKTGLQYMAYEQSQASFYDTDVTWNGIDPFIGTGVQYSFPAGVRARLDYRYAKQQLEVSDREEFHFVHYDEEIEVAQSTFAFTVNYQF